MINDVGLKRIFSNIWRYAVALLFCLVCYRHRDLPPELLNELRDATDFVTLQVPQSNLGAWVHGFLHNWDYKESLADFVKDGYGPELQVPEKLDPSELRAPRGTTQVVGRRSMRKVNGYKW